MTDCEHKYVYVGIVFKIDNYPLPGSSAKEITYFDKYFCEKCLNIRHIELNDKSNTYNGIKYDAKPMTK